MAGKRVSLAALAGAKVESVPGASVPELIHVHPDTVLPTPLNPRLDFSEEGLRELGEAMRDNGQLQPCVAVPRSVYLKLYPDHVDRIPDTCRHVLAAGERRWRAAKLVGLDTLDLLVRRDLAENRVRFLRTVLSENIDRENFNYIEEAHGLQAMLDLHEGNQAAAARALSRSRQWYSQRIGLLRLSDDMVRLVREGKLTAFREMRRYATLPAEEQYPTWKADQEAPPPPKPQAVTTPAEGGEMYTAVYTPAADEAPPTGSAFSPLPAEAAVQQPRSEVPEPRVSSTSTPLNGETDAVTAGEVIPAGKPLPYDDGGLIGAHLIRKLEPEQFVAALRVMISHAVEAGLEVPLPSKL